jgi:hypothetical protein
MEAEFDGGPVSDPTPLWEGNQDGIALQQRRSGPALNGR